MRHGWYCHRQFDSKRYVHYSNFINGDFNWIVPFEIAAFSSPADESQSRLRIHQETKMLNSVSTVLTTLKAQGIKCVIRLNEPLYDRRAFTCEGIAHYDLFFPDGSVPDLVIFS